MSSIVVLYAAQAALAAILLLGAFDKLRDFHAFESAIAGYQLLPAVMHRPFAATFVAAEALGGVLLLSWSGSVAGAGLGMITLVIAMAGLTINLLRGRTDIDCGCGGVSGSATGLSWWLVVRNSVLCVDAVAILAAHLGAISGHHLSWLGVDGITFVGTTLALLGLYFIFNQLVEVHMRIQKLRSQS
ncbi:MAG TPA: MauE/DoxX family redox-associated membrane protein [Nevskiaceae bacterium]